MILEIFNKNRIRVGMIRQCKSASYEIKFNGVGTFTINISVIDESVEYLIRGNYILFDKDVMGVITRRSKVSSTSTEITINGYLVSRLLSYRVIPTTQEYYGTVEEITEQLINNNFISPSDGKRKIDYITVDNPVGTNGKVRIQKTGDDVETAIEAVLSLENKGFNFKPIIQKYDEESETFTNIKSFEFSVIVPVDRTMNNSDGNNPIVFSMQLNNLSEIEFDEDGSDYRNVAIVAGAGEGEERITLEVGDSDAEGVERIETYVDARDLSNTEFDEDGEEVEIPDADYNELLQTRGNEILKESEVSIDVEGKIITEGEMVNTYGVDYFLGDYVSVIDDSLGYVVNAQITSMTKTISSGTEKVDLTFGYQKESLKKMLKKRGVI